MELPKFADILINSIISYALPLMRAGAWRKQALNVILRGTRTNAIYLEWEQREEHFKKPDICGNLVGQTIANMKTKARNALPAAWKTGK